MIRVILLLIGYCFGLFQTGYIYSKAHGVDIRTRGSGNAGSTNVLRVFGLKGGLTTFVGDFLKSFIPCMAVKLFFTVGSGAAMIDPAAQAVNILQIGMAGTDVVTLVLWIGLGVVLGHDFPFWLKFRGGKGIASSLAIVCVIDWRVGLLAIAIWLIIVLPTGYVSLGSIVSFIAVLIYACITFESIESKILIFILTGLAVWQHRSNIKRLISGTENKLNLKRG